MSALDRLYREWRHAANLADRFASRPAGDPVRTKWADAARTALAALKDEEARLLDPAAKLHP